MLLADCPKTVTSIWHKMITNSIKKRVDDMVRFRTDSIIVMNMLRNSHFISQRPVFRLNLFLLIESHKFALHVMKEIVADAMSKRLEDLLSVGVSINYVYIHILYTYILHTYTYICNRIRENVPFGEKNMFSFYL